MVLAVGLSAREWALTSVIVRWYGSCGTVMRTESGVSEASLSRSSQLRRCIAAGIFTSALIGALLVPALAFAYPTDDGPFTCNQCHATDSVSGTEDWEGKGPHGYYAETTQKCEVCHTVHAAPGDSILLLTGPTVSASCLNCHDGTGGVGPYHAIEARGGSVVASHTVETTTVVPGGSTELSDVLSCSSCHSVHRTGTVAPFYRDSGYAFASQQLTLSDCLLRSDVNTDTPGAFPVYGAQWCASCHDERHSQAASVNNHPVETSFSFGYGEVTSTPGAEGPARDREQPALGGYILGMGQTNGGYVMSPVDASPDGRVEARRAPLCMQCHEDARNVESTYTADYTGDDPSADNPLFLSFPHQGTNPSFLVETDDDLCLNCHAVTLLP